MAAMNGDPLAGLAPAHAPPPVGWWPPAPGWWALAVLALLAAAGFVVWWRSPRRRLRRAALRELKQIRAVAQDDAKLAQALEDFTRRYALARYDRATVAALSGQRWLDFIVARGAADWKGEAGAALLRAAYGGAAEGQRERWLAGAQAFVSARK